MSNIRRPLVTLPPAPAQYDQRAENEFRRIIAQALAESVVDLKRPSLSVTKSIGTTSYSIAWAGSPNVQVSIAGGAWTTPSASPITASRNASGGLVKQYTFRAGPDDSGQYVTSTVDVLPQEASPSTDPNFTAAYVSGGTAPGDGTGTVEVTFTHENFPVGWTVNIAITNATGEPITEASGEVTGVTASPAEVEMALGPASRFDVALTAYDVGLVPIAYISFFVDVFPV